MKTLQAEVPELLLQEVKELAEKQNASVDQIVSVALAAQVSAGALVKVSRPAPNA